jgi:hypothetical protein
MENVVKRDTIGGSGIGALDLACRSCDEPRTLFPFGLRSVGGCKM